MLFTSKVLSTLEYDKIIEMLADLAQTDGAKARALSLAPIADYDAIVLRQTRTEDAKRLINAKGYPAFSAPESVVPSAVVLLAMFSMYLELRFLGLCWT